jgi:hypothetical protein
MIITKKPKKRPTIKPTSRVTRPERKASKR